MLDVKSFFAINYLSRSYRFGTGVCLLMKKADASSIKNEKLYLFISQVLTAYSSKLLTLKSMFLKDYKQNQVKTRLPEMKIEEKNKKGECVSNY